MSDTRAAIRELRSLSEKRSTQGLTEQERSRLVELRERLGLPSEPSEARTDGSQPGGTPASARLPSPGATPPRTTTTDAAPPAPTAPAALPRLDAPEPPPFPRLEPDGPPPEPGPPLTASGRPETVPEPHAALEPAALAPEVEPGAMEVLAPAEDLAAPVPLPDLEPELQASFDALSDATTDPAIEMHALAEASASTSEASAPPPGPEALPPEPVLEPTTTLPDLEAQAGLPELEAAGVGVDPLDTAAVPLDAALPPDEAWAGVQAPAETGAAPLDALAPAEEAPLQPAPPEPPRRPSLAERIDAAVEATEETSPAEGGPLAWDAGPEPLVPEEDLGATPLDVADPAAEFSAPGDGAPIELSSADVVLLESEPAGELELGGAPEDPVPLAGLHEFIGQQPENPHALAFEDQGEPPTFVPEELQATGAELAAVPQTFHPAPREVLPELEPKPAPPPAPAAPRIVVPRPPPGPPPSRPAPAAAPQPRVAPVSGRPAVPPPASAVASAAAPPPPPARAVQVREAGTSPARRSGAMPPAPPAAAFVLGEDGRRLPAIAAAVPEPPQLLHQQGRSGPFGRPQALLLTPAPLDVMDGGDELSPEPTPMPATDVATGAEIFGGTYLSPTFVEGEHRVVLHTLEGQVRRGTVKDLDLLDPVIRLAQPGRPPEAIATERVKAIFFMQEPGTAPLPSVGRRIRVGFADGRQIVGFSEDVETGENGFFLVPADTRTHTARIYVFRAGVASISAA